MLSQPPQKATDNGQRHHSRTKVKHGERLWNCDLEHICPFSLDSATVLQPRGMSCQHFRHHHGAYSSLEWSSCDLVGTPLQSCDYCLATTSCSVTFFCFAAFETSLFSVLFSTCNILGWHQLVEGRRDEQWRRCLCFAYSANSSWTFVAGLYRVISRENTRKTYTTSYRHIL